MTKAERSPPDVVCFGEVLWDILPTGPLPGGAPMNVAYNLKKLGAEPALITKIGQDHYGERLKNILSESSVSTEYFSVDPEHPTGLVNVNVNDRQDVVYDIVYPSAWDFIEWKEEYKSLLPKAAYFVYGSLTSRHKVSRETLTLLLESANTKVFDINLRRPHYHPKQIEYLLGKTDILKMNITELELVAGWFNEFKSIVDRIKLIQDRFRIDTVIVTMGGDGAMVSDRGNIHTHNGFKVHVADTIGSGDAFLAGYLHQLMTGSSVEDALIFASGIGAFVATQQGACAPYEVVRVYELIGSKQNHKFIHD